MRSVPSGSTADRADAAAARLRNGIPLTTVHVSAIVGVSTAAARNRLYAAGGKPRRTEGVKGLAWSVDDVVRAYPDLAAAREQGAA